MKPKRRRHHPSERGFAMLLVVIIVSILAVSAATLLDLVNIDMVIVGQQRKVLQAHANVQGAMMESLGDREMRSVFPTHTTPALSHTWVSGNTKFGPSGATTLDPSVSAYVKHVGTPQEETYEADIRLLRTAPVKDTGINTAHAVLYEVRTVADVHQGEASKEARTEVFIYQATRGDSYRAQRIHAR